VSIIPNKLLNLNEIKNKVTFFALVSAERDRKAKNYFASSYLQDKKGKYSVVGSYDSEWHNRQSYLYNTFKIDYINDSAIRNNKVPIFLTLTLPSEYHPSSKKYNSELTVVDGKNKLMEIWRRVYNGFYVDRVKNTDLDFVKVIEPHKSWVPHLHAIVYVPLEFVDRFKKHLFKSIKYYNLKQYDVKTLDVASYASTYLLKYVDKTLDSDAVIRGWKSYYSLGKSIFSTSALDIGIDRDIFRRVSDFIKYDPKDKENNVYFRQILNKIYVEKTLIDEFGNFVSKKTYGNPLCTNKVFKTVKKEVHRIELSGSKKISRGILFDFDLYCVDEGTANEFYYEVSGNYVPCSDDVKVTYATKFLQVIVNEEVHYSLGDVTMSSFMSPYLDSFTIEDEQISEDFWFPTL